MFSKTITECDFFLDMPLSSQALYFHLGMQADDDGFVSPNRIVRMIGSQPDDLKVLLTKKFIIPFDNGVVVIKHWKENNYIQKDRKKDTLYKKELKLLNIENNVYKMDTDCIQNVRLGKDSIGKDSIVKDILGYWKLKKSLPNHKENILLRKIQKKHFTILNSYSFEEIKKAIDNYNIILTEKKYYWSHRWTLWEFITRGLDRFVNVDLDKDFLDKNYKPNAYEQLMEERNK